MERKLNKWKYILFFFIVIINHSDSFSQCSLFFRENTTKPIVKRGHRTFNMNRFKTHVAMYVVHVKNEDSLCEVFTDSLMCIKDTLLVRICDKGWKECSDTLISKGESWRFINNSYWQKIPLNRLYMIKSKRQPLAAITVGLIGVAYTAFLGGLIVGGITKNINTQEIAFQTTFVGNLSCIISYVTNVWIAKKRFKFNRFTVKNKHWILI